MAKCSRCGKGPQFGHNRSHSMRATNRQFQVNIQPTIIIEKGHKKRVHLCTRCLRTLAKND